MPHNLLEAVDRYGRHDWLASLPAAIDDIAQQWELELGDPFQPGGQSAWVAPARDAAGADRVLKVAWRHPEATHEAEGLRLWDGDGAVLVHAAMEHEQTAALLLERCVPGTILSSQAEPAQDIVIASLLRRLWREPPVAHPFRSLQTMCTEWADQYEAVDAACTELDPGLAAAGIALFRALPASADRAVVVCTDLHAGNVLAAQREPWLVIDPKPYVGDPTFDALQHLLNCGDRLRADPDALVRRLAELCELDSERLRLWLFARCVQESPGWPGLADVAVQVAPE